MATQAIAPHLRRPDDYHHGLQTQTIKWETYPVAKALLESCYQLNLLANDPKVDARERVQAREAIYHIDAALNDYRFQVMDDEAVCDPDVLVDGTSVADAIRTACTIKLTDVHRISDTEIVA